MSDSAILFGMVKSTHKTIGTFVPVFSLISSEQKTADQGTFATGIFFLDWLHKTGQNAWQMLPLHQTQLEIGSKTKHVPSPYKSYGIGLDPRFLSSEFRQLKPTKKERDTFLQTHKDWLTDYALFCALRDHFGSDEWQTWDADIRKRNPQTLQFWSEKLHDAIEKHILTQWQLHQSFAALKKKARDLGIVLIGDLSFYIAHNSPLVWAHQEAFLLHGGVMEFVSGIPNTPGTHFGRQVWGHPLYNWHAKEDVLSFWKMRLIYQSELYDSIRIDHAKAFFAYGVMDLRDATNDRYTDGPGADFFESLLTFSAKHQLTIFAEDSGDRVQELRAYLRSADVWGIKIFWFAFQKEQINSKYAEIQTYPEHCVASTTTHDTQTLIAYLASLTEQQKKILAQTAQVTHDKDDKILAARFRDAVVESPANTVIIPIQDWLLTTDRINMPGTEKEHDDPNWHYTIGTPIEQLPLKF